MTISCSVACATRVKSGGKKLGGVLRHVAGVAQQVERPHVGALPATRPAARAARPQPSSCRPGCASARGARRRGGARSGRVAVHGCVQASARCATCVAQLGELACRCPPASSSSRRRRHRGVGLDLVARRSNSSSWRIGMSCVLSDALKPDEREMLHDDLLLARVASCRSCRKKSLSFVLVASASGPCATPAGRCGISGERPDHRALAELVGQRVLDAVQVLAVVGGDVDLLVGHRQRCWSRGWRCARRLKCVLRVDLVLREHVVARAPGSREVEFGSPMPKLRFLPFLSTSSSVLSGLSLCTIRCE